ncbi:hypothetical protein E1301_Tti010323 [Triplophysa tibetana]|uniref:Uncharacterized protein n=1 Tax=Triplophysa tibetana TaxID=1572043 RepID=A0A5A9PV79_9TELE|nr:hypothetical protein E1301_Tti010323 [Triplophysa tibetana]
MSMIFIVVPPGPPSFWGPSGGTQSPTTSVVVRSRKKKRRRYQVPVRLQHRHPVQSRSGGRPAFQSRSNLGSSPVSGPPGCPAGSPADTSANSPPGSPSSVVLFVCLVCPDIIVAAGPHKENNSLLLRTRGYRSKLQ